MRLPNYTLIGLFSMPGVLANLLGPTYPPPRDLSSSNSRVAASWKNLTSQLNAYLDGHANGTSGVSALKNLTFSAGLFSTLDPKAEHLQYHHTASEVAESPIGAKKVDGDSIYKVASVSKLFTVLAGLLELDDKDWERPLTDIFPSLAEQVRGNRDKFQLTRDVQWDKITLKAIASQMSGIPHGGTAEFLYKFALAKISGSHNPKATDPNFYGLPPLNDSDLSLWPPCIGDQVQGCNPVPWDEGYAASAPVFLPWASPEYANNNFALLGLAISNLTGKTMDGWYGESIFDPLGMKSTFSSPPDNSSLSHHVTAETLQPEFQMDGGATIPSGGLFSTTNDLAKFGVGLLNSTLLPSEKTHEWMKPVTRTASLRYSVGKPWEIHRFVHAKSGIVTDIYTKLGDSGSYGGIVAIIPEFSAGFSFLGASSLASRSPLMLLAIDLITDSILPALMEQAACEAKQKFAGTYKAESLNSSITFSVVPPMQPEPGLKISSWVSNGTDLMPQFEALFSGKNVRLVPTIVPEDVSGKIAFRSYTSPDVKPNVGIGASSNLFSSLYDVSKWLTLDSLLWGAFATDLFIFDVEKDGKVKAVTPTAYRVKMEKK
ncbi:hypothetical protein PENANT_c043G03653 [Penicillium antarcticum]|uniref:Uncharacterized protein n=1 Tax=Penicillium antarcticum TaxID=416450 RepID=A0A1V6PS22_9EURO|nr:uncharacterized protein N7508_002605 [Penicillium antarcticum]KAJ5318097.1 hypothetical protein N7508_002605 [Penicillium antarcticum]OQD79829.1 hypothetical protein PENANT_c043G03653 [Penicillium antarcticum]